MSELEDPSSEVLPSSNQNEDKPSLAQKRNDLAALLPIFGVLFFATPLISTITNDNPSGIGGTAFYIFSIWALLILAAWFLARLLRGEDTRKDEAE